MIPSVYEDPEARRRRAQDNANRRSRRIADWPLVVDCPIESYRSTARRTASSASGLTYRCESCGLVFKVPVAQVDKRSIRKALRLGPVPR